MSSIAAPRIRSMMERLTLVITNSPLPVWVVVRRAHLPCRSHPSCRRHLHLTLTHEHRRAADADARDCAPAFVDFDLHDARPPHFEALLDDPAQRPVVPRAPRREIAPEGKAGAPGRRVFRTPKARRVDPRVYVGALEFRV